MGKIKSRLTKRTTNTLIERGIEFTDTFDDNKKILGSTMPSKKLRNQIAGYITRVIRMKNIEAAKQAAAIKK